MAKRKSRSKKTPKKRTSKKRASEKRASKKRASKKRTSKKRASKKRTSKKRPSKKKGVKKKPKAVSIVPVRHPATSPFRVVHICNVPADELTATIEDIKHTPGYVNHWVEPEADGEFTIVVIYKN